ncbi:HNH endonuclease, partial [Geodermatophilus sp. CPCC 205506]|uniref:HNH endonuclease n=1 Tax=Geodermatophilus sp. CPCC 205506 TaxID=2936596 RepID=UPI003EF0797E
MESSVAAERSPVEGALVGWCLEQPATNSRLPVALLTKAEKAAEMQRLQARKAMDAAYEAELVLGLADDTPDTGDPPPGSPGAKRGSWAPDAELPGVSEFFVPELAMVLNCGRGTAGHLAARAWTYRENLPGTWAALAAGTLDEPRAKVLADVLGSTSPAIARAIEAVLLPQAAGLSLGRLRARALALLLERDAAAADQRRRTARRSADVRSYPSALEGMATLAADLPAPVSAACLDVVDQLAAMLKADGDPRPIGELRAAVLAELITRPWDDSRPAVTAQLRITVPLASLAGASNEPGEVSGLPITAAHLRELVARLGALGLRAPAGGSLSLALTDPDGALRATATAAALAG